MTPLTTVTVIIPTFNRAGLLPRALHSVLAQTRRPDQLIVVDDGSTDGTSELVPRLAPQALLLRQEREGHPAARNLALGRATGELIAFLDSDDEWMPDHLAACLDTLLRCDPSVGLVFSGVMIVDRSGRTLARRTARPLVGPVLRDVLLDPHTDRLGPTFSSVVIRSDVFRVVGHFDTRLRAMPDWEMWVRIASRFAFAFSGRVTARITSHPGQMSHDMDVIRRYREMAIDIVGAQDAIVSRVSGWRRVTHANVYVGIARGYYAVGRMRAARREIAAAVRLSPRRALTLDLPLLLLKTFLGRRLSARMRAVRAWLYDVALKSRG